MASPDHDGQFKGFQSDADKGGKGGEEDVGGTIFTTFDLNLAGGIASS